MADTLTFIVTHAKPLVPPKFYDHEIALGDYGKEFATHVSRLDPFWHLARPVAYQAAGSYAVPRAVEHLNLSPAVIGVLSQRKLISRDMVGTLARTAPHMRQLSADDLSTVDMSQTRAAAGHEFLVAQPLYFHKGVVAQYASCHEALDLFDYMSLAVEIGLISTSDLNSFANERQMIPGGCELGFYSSSWLLPVLQKMEEVGRAFITKNRSRIIGYDDYQVRALSFLSERLGSFLLLKHLRQIYGPKIDDAVFGHMCTIVDHGHYTRGVAGSPPETSGGQSGDDPIDKLNATYAGESGRRLGPNRCLGKIATQSSVGPWSLSQDPAEDATRAISGVLTGFYSFHTAFEDQPWWMVDLGEIVKIEEVRIYNAEAAIAARSAKFVLESSLDGHDWHLMHERIDETPFGGFDGNPFVWRDERKIAAQHIRIRLTTASWLHLDQVEIYGTPAYRDPRDNIVEALAAV